MTCRSAGRQRNLLPTIDNSTSAHSNACASSISTMRAGMAKSSASCAARKRLAPATISKPSEFGRTVMGWMRPCCLMLSASSCSLDSSNVRRGLAADSWMVSRARNWNALLFCMIALLGRVEGLGVGCEHDALCPLSCGKSLGPWGLPPFEGFGEALQTQVVVPLPGELLVLLVQAGKVNVVGYGNCGQSAGA